METKPENSHLKGQALIALAAAAGVIAASRLSRTGLALTAGLAWHVWSRWKARPGPVQAWQPEEAAAATAPPSASPDFGKEVKLPPDLQPEAEPTIEPSAVLPRPAEVEDTHSPAWDDLRAALAPSLEAMPEAAVSGHVEAEASWATYGPADSSSLTPPLPEIHPFPPTNPWMEAIDPIPPQAAELPAWVEPEQPDFLIDPEEQPPEAATKPAPLPSGPGTTTLLPRPAQPPSIIARSESGTLPTPAPMTTPSSPVMHSSNEDGTGKAAPPENDEKKNFFDWLRS